MPITNDTGSETEQTPQEAQDQVLEPTSAAPAAEPVQQDVQDAIATDEEAADVTSSTASETVTLGAASGSLHRLSTDDVQTSLPEWAERIAALRVSPTISELQERMRETDGRCAPIYFGENGQVLSGIDALAAAIELGLPQVSVVMIDAGETSAAQAYLALQVTNQP